MLNGSNIIRSLWRRLARNREGNVALIFGLAMIPIVCAAGVAIDATRAYQVKVRLGAAMDAAALAVGSSTPPSTITDATQIQTWMGQRLTNYFKANYPPGALGQNVTITPVGTSSNPSGNLTSSSVTFQAQATVPMTFMSLVGFKPVTVTVTNQIHKSAGLEVVLVLDNTGSMLCGPNDGAPTYSPASLCQGNVVASDTNCTNPSNQSRICTLRNAATQFVNTLVNAISSQQQLLIGVVPYVTTVNVGSLFCSGATNCSNVAMDACNLDWVNEKGDIITTGVVNLPAAPTITANTTSGSKIVTNISPATNSSWVGTIVTGTGIPANTTVASVDSASQIHLSANATSTHTGSTLTLNWTAKTTSGSNTVTIFPNVTPFTAGMVIKGNGVAGFATTNAVTSVNSAQSQIKLCGNATTTGSTRLTNTGSGPTLTLNNSLTYDTTHSATTANWMGCVVEPTSSDENVVSGGAVNSATADPDTSEPVASMKWYPFWWPAGATGINNWTPGTIVAQTNANPGGEIQGQVTTDWETFNGPNEGCPVPVLPLTDVTTTTGKNAVLNTINSMWPRDAGGTAVHIGMAWGWRVISPNTPFTASNGGYTPVSGHPMAYSDAITQGWTKVVVLMTDGTEEWPDANGYTGLGFLNEGKIGTTTSTATAVSNLDTRLHNICQNMADPSKNIVIYTIGLGSDGASNTTLQHCATAYNGGFFEAADTSNLQLVFNDVAQALLALRLAK